MASWNVSLKDIGLLARWIGYWYTLLPRDGLVVCLQPCCKFLVLFYQEPAGLNGSQVLYSQTSISLNWLGWSGAGPQNLETLSSGSESTLYCTECVRVRVRRVTVSGIVCPHPSTSVGRGRCPSAIWSNLREVSWPPLPTPGVQSAVSKHPHRQ